MDRLLKASRIFGDSQTGNPFVTQLGYENANAVCLATIRPSKVQTGLAGYIHLGTEIGPLYNQGLAMAAAFQGIIVRAMLSQK